MVADFIGTMNLFPARVLGAANPGVRVEAAGSARSSCRGRPRPAAEVGVAVRPEKVALSREPPGAGLIAVRGTVAQVAYFGDYSQSTSRPRPRCASPATRPTAAGATRRGRRGRGLLGLLVPGRLHPADRVSGGGAAQGDLPDVVGRRTRRGAHQKKEGLRGTGWWVSLRVWVLHLGIEDSAPSRMATNGPRTQTRNHISKTITAPSAL